MFVCFCWLVGRKKVFNNLNECFSTHAEDTSFDELGDLGGEGRVLEDLRGFSGVLLERLQSVLNFRRAEDVLDFRVSHGVLRTFFLVLLAMSTGVRSGSGLCEEILDFLVLRSEFKTLFVRSERLVVLLHREVAVTLLRVRLHVSGVQSDSLLQILESAREFHKLNVADTTVRVVLRVLRASADRFAVFLQRKRE